MAQNRLFHKLPLALLPVLVRYGKNLFGPRPSEEGPGRQLSFSLRGLISFPNAEIAIKIGFLRADVYGIFELTKEARGPFFHSWFNPRSRHQLLQMEVFDTPISGVRRNPYFTSCPTPGAFKIESDGSHVSQVGPNSVIVEFEGRRYFVILPRSSE